MEIAPGAAAVRVGRVLREPQGGPRLSGQGGVLAETDVIRAGAVSPLITCIMYACVNTGGKYLLRVAMTSLVHRLLSGLLQLLPNWCTKLTPGLEPQASVAKKNFIMTSLLDTCEPTPIGPKGFILVGGCSSYRLLSLHLPSAH